MLSKKQLNEFNDCGFLVIKNFYDYESEIKPIQYDIWRIIQVINNKYKIKSLNKTFNTNSFHHDLQNIISHKREYCGEIYDAVKQLTSFKRLVSSENNEKLFCLLRKTDLCGISLGGYGIRIDNPNEEKFRSLWHYEYRDQLRSTDGLVFWSPLVKITKDIGPVKICSKSHKDGLRKSFSSDIDNPDKSGVYGMRLENEKQIISKYKILEPLIDPSDLLIMDFLTLHSSGVNYSKTSRLSMQFRYFNFLHKSGIDIAWAGCKTKDPELKLIHPELIIEKND